MPSVSVLKEYLISLRWDIKQGDLKRVDTSIQGTERILKNFNAELIAAASAVAAYVFKTAENFDRLYFSAQRIGTTAFNLQQFQYAAKQVGVSAEEMGSAITSVGMAMRMPGQSAVLRRWGVESKDATDATVQLIGRLKQLPYFLGQAQAQNLGIAPQTFYQLSTNFDKLQKFANERAGRVNEAGGRKDLDAVFNEFMTNWRQLLDQIDIVGSNFAATWIPGLNKVVNVAKDLLVEFSKLDKTTKDIVATIAIGAAGIGIYRGASMLLGGLLGRGGRVAAAATASAAATGAGTAGATAGGGILARLGLTKLGIGSGALTTGLAAGASLFVPDKYLSKDLQEARQNALKWLGDKIKKDVAQPGASPGFDPNKREELPISKWYREHVLGQGGQTPLAKLFAGTNLGKLVHGELNDNQPQAKSQVDKIKNTISDWFGKTNLGSFLRGNLKNDPANDPSKDLRDWLHGVSSFVPKVQITGNANAETLASGKDFGAVGEAIDSKVQSARKKLAEITDWVSVKTGIKGHTDKEINETRGAISSTAASNNESIQRGIKFFMDKGLTKEQSTGIVARMSMESGGGKSLNPNAVNPTSGAYGIAQWLGSRKPDALATSGDLDKQLELVWKEFQGAENKAFNKIKQSGSAYDAAIAMESFERAGNPSFTEKAARLAAGIIGSSSAMAATGKTPNITTSGPLRDLRHMPSGLKAPPGVKYNTMGQPYSTELETMSKKEKENVDQVMKSMKDARDSGKGGSFFRPKSEVMKEFEDLTKPNAPWNDNNSGALTPGGAVGKQSNVTIEQNNHFQVSGFSPDDVGREVNRGMGRTNADLVRNLTSKVA
jgi:hypothetical protein